MCWSKQVWEKSSRIYEAITKHPFIRELADGSLDNQKFNRYLAQDEVYIGNYGRQMFQLTDRWAEKAGEKTVDGMSDAFLGAALYEYAFWDYGYYGDAKTYDYMNDYKKWI